MTSEPELLMEEGAEAFRAGLPLNACPYMGAAQDDWQDGWWQAHHEEQALAESDANVR